MKMNFRNSFTFLITVTALVGLVACKKDILTESVSPNLDNYAGINDFFEKNQVPTQTFTIDAQKGGTFTGAKGTVFNIPDSAFVTSGGNLILGNIKFEIKEIYEKSDMLLSNKPTSLFLGKLGNKVLESPLESGGEFFIKAISDSGEVKIKKGAQIIAEMPDKNDIDSNMRAFVQNDSSSVFNWVLNSNAYMLYSTTDYIYNLYAFSNNADGGTWCNSDNSVYFSAYSQVKIELNQIQGTEVEFGTNVFLVFKNVNSMVHVYSNGAGKFTYDYAPKDLECTVVALGVKDGVLYASFTPLKITDNATVNFNFTETTTEAFKARLALLN